VHPKASWAGLICRTHQHYHRQWLSNTEWSNFFRWVRTRDRWLWKERLWEKRVLRREWVNGFPVTFRLTRIKIGSRKIGDVRVKN